MPSVGAAPFYASPLLGDREMEKARPLEAVCFVLDRHSDPLFIVDPSRKLHFWNVSAKRVLETRQSLRLQGGRLSMGAPRDDRRLEELLQSMQSGVIGRAPSRGLRLQRPSAQQGWVVAVHLLESKQPAGEGGPLYLFHAVSRLHRCGTLDPLLRDLFGLTPGEMAAATALLRTGSVGNAARVLSVSRETIRTQLKAVFRKCDIHSTLELAALLGSASLFSGPDPVRIAPRQWSGRHWENP